jgi:hypothetical protein
MTKNLFLICTLILFFTSGIARGDGEPGNLPELSPGGKQFSEKIPILSPDQSAKWEEGTTKTIRWSMKINDRRGVKIDLLDAKNKVVHNITQTLSVPKLPGGSSSTADPSELHGVPRITKEYQWNIPKGIYKFPGNYRIKISTSDNRAVGYSNVFHISMTLKEIFDSIPAKTDNFWRRKGERKSLAIPFTDIPWPGYLDREGYLPAQVHSGKILVGYENEFSKTSYVVTSTHEYKGYAYRGYIFFPLDNFYGRKGLLTKATLQMRIANTLTSTGSSVSNQKYSYASKLYKLTAPIQSFNGPSTEFYCNLPMKKGSLDGGIFDGVDTLSVNLTSLVRGWMQYKESNHGLLVVGPNEKFDHNNDAKYTLYENIRLKMEFIEQDH